MLLTTVSRHFQPITIIKWSSDGSYVITGNYFNFIKFDFKLGIKNSNS